MKKKCVPFSLKFTAGDIKNAILFAGFYNITFLCSLQNKERVNGIFESSVVKKYLKVLNNYLVLEGKFLQTIVYGIKLITPIPVVGVNEFNRYF